MADADKIMFEIYREADSGGQYCVVYFTELSEHNRNGEIRRAMEGEHFYDSFLQAGTLALAREKIRQILERLNRGEHLPVEAVEAELGPYLA